jgi:hypothetical protein
VGSKTLAWYAEFLLEINLRILSRKIGARLNFKIALISLHSDPDAGIADVLGWKTRPSANRTNFDRSKTEPV